MTLGPPTSKPGRRTPFQIGRARGVDRAGSPREVDIEWLIDSGADVPVIQDRVAKTFTLKATGGTASPTVGAVTMLMYEGLEVEATVDQGGYLVPRAAPVDVGVKPNDQGSNLLGVAALHAMHATIVWSARRQAGVLLDESRVDADGQFRWWADPRTLSDAQRALAAVRDSRPDLEPTSDDPATILKLIRDRYRHEVETLLKGFVGYREARAIMCAGVDAWNAHLSPVSAVDAGQRRAHAGALGSIVAELQTRCTSIDNPEIQQQIAGSLLWVADNAARHARWLNR